MRVTQQLNNNECGACVINSLINHFYHNENYHEVLDYCSINQLGLNLFEFENACLHFGINATSYQLSFNEFINLEINDYFVLLINKKEGNHFVIAMKNKDNIVIYDSAIGKYDLTYEELGKTFGGILIKVRKLKKVKINLKEKIDWFSLNPSWLIISVCIQMLIAGITVAFGLFMNSIIDLTINTQALKTLIFICFTFLIIGLMKNIGNYIYSWLIIKVSYDTYLTYKNKLLKRLFNKKKSFINKVDQNYFYLLNDAIYAIGYFELNNIPNLISDIVINFIIFIIVVIVNIPFLPIIAIGLIFELIYLFLAFIRQKDLYEKAIKTNNNINHLSQKYIFNQTHHHNAIINNHLKDDINQSFHSAIELHNTKNLFDNRLGLIKTIFNDAIYIAIVFVGILIINKKETMSVGQLFFIISTLVYFLNNLSNIAGFILQYINYKKMKNIYLMFYEVDNIQSTGNVVINKLKNISFNFNGSDIKIKHLHELKQINLGELSLFLTNRIVNNDYDFFINNINIKEINQISLNKMICYFNFEQRLLFKTDNELDLLQKPFVSEVMKKLDLANENKKITIYQLINLLNEKNKIIIFDNFFSIYNNEEKKLIKNTLLKNISKENFIIHN